MVNDINDCRDASPAARLRLFSCLSANVHALLRLIEGPNPCVEVVVVLKLQARRNDMQLYLVRKLFEAQLMAVHKATREAACKEV